MDSTKFKVLCDRIDELATSGDITLCTKKMKDIKRICKESDDYVRHCFDLIWSQLKKEHSEVRFSCFQMVDELFCKSHVFRTLLLDNFQTYLELALEIDLDCPLPPPKKAAERLKNAAYQALRKWHEKYSSGYRKLELAYNYLRSCHQVDFNKADHMTALQRQREREAEIQKQNQQAKRIANVTKEIEEKTPDILDIVTQLGTCLRLLMADSEESGIDVFDESLLDQPETKSSTESNCTEEALRQHGFVNRKMNININISQRKVVKESEDNTDIIHNLDELKVLLTMKYLPLITKWLSVYQKNGADQQLLTSTIDLKQTVLTALQDLDILSIHRLDEDSDDDGDLVDVPEEVDEVAFMKATLGMSGIPSTQPSTSKQTNTKSMAPVIDYDLDLEYWDNPDELKVPEALPTDASRGWINTARNFSVHSSLQELYSSRKIEFAGKFVPVKWSCRALLATGRLCPRMDRIKCPFHGLIIARNDDGTPANAADVEKFKQIKEKQRRANPEWQDTALLQDIQAQTGINLKVEKKNDKTKKSNLTNIRKVNNTPRQRLESKVLSRRALKRVAGALNTLDSKRLKDKFCHSFNATFAK